MFTRSINTVLSVAVIFLATLCFTGCKDSSKSADNDCAEAAHTIDSDFVATSELDIRMMQAMNKASGAQEDAKLSEVIKAYENEKDLAKRASIFSNYYFSNDDDPRMQRAMAMAQDAMDRAERRAERNGAYLPSFTLTAADKNFDLAIQQNDMAVQQVKMMNSYFQDLDQTTMNAITYYEGLSKDDKVKMLSNTSLTPVPDYQANIARFLERGYLLKQYLLTYRLRQYVTRTKWVNEFPQGYKSRATASTPGSDTRFDLERPIAMAGK